MFEHILQRDEIVGLSQDAAIGEPGRVGIVPVGVCVALGAQMVDQQLVELFNYMERVEIAHE